jgi:SAM-dependent methyltransferase
VDFLKDLLPAGGSVLDVGCGIGLWTREAASVASRVVGVDHNARSIEEARRLSSTLSNVSYFVGEATSTPGAPFDVAFVIHLLEHIDEPVELLAQLKRVAATLVIEVPDFTADSLNVARLWLGRPFDSDADHVREYTPDVLQRQLSSVGWTVSSVTQRAGSIVALATGDSPG